MAYLIDASLKKISTVYLMGGLRLERSESRKINIIYFCILINNIIWLGSDALCGVWWFIDGLNTGKSLKEVMDITPCSSFCTLGFFKLFSMLSCKSETAELIAIFRQLEQKTTSVMAERSRIVDTNMKLFNFIINCSNISYITLTFLFFISCFIFMGIHYQETGELVLLYPFMLKYPFDANNLRVYPYVYLHQTWSEIVSVVNIALGDYFFYTCAIYIHMHMQLLGHDFEKIAIERKQVQNAQYDERFRLEFKELVQWHKQVIRATKVLDTMYAIPTLYNFFISSVLICLTGFNVIAVKDVARAITFFSFLFVNMVQIFTLCYLGDMVMFASIAISDGVYRSRWYIAEASVAKDLLMVQQRAQKPCKFSACGYADVNLAAFMKILSTSWSYFCLLNTMSS